MVDTTVLQELCRRIDAAMRMQARGAIASQPVVFDLPPGWDDLAQEKLRVWCATRTFEIKDLTRSSTGGGALTIGAPTIAPAATSSSLILDDGVTLPDCVARLLHGEVGDVSWFDPLYTAAIDRLCGDLLVIGAGFYEQYVKDTPLAQFGIHVMFKLMVGTPPTELVLEGRAYRGDERLYPFTSAEFQALLLPYRTGFLRLATPDERRLFYALIDFEIDGQAVHVVESDVGRLLLFAPPGGGLRWIDYLDRYHLSGHS